MNISYGTYFQHDLAEDVLNSSVATGHEITVDAQDLNKDIRGLKGVGVFSVSGHRANLRTKICPDMLVEMGQIH